MRRKFGLIPRDESFFELFEWQASILRDCLSMLASMCTAQSVDPHWAVVMQSIGQRGGWGTRR